jgi:uncharacterized protein
MKRLPNLIASVGLALALAGAALAQEVKGVDGDWTGKLDVGGGQTLTVIFHIKTAAGKTGVTLDSPDQGAVGIPVAGIKRDGQKVSMDVQAVMGTYEGTLAADGKSMTGTWSQPGGELPLVVTKQ